jgi:hypothetical protein
VQARAAKYGKVFRSSLLGWPIVSMDAPAGNKFMFANDGKRLDAFYPKSVTAILGKEAFVYKPNEVHRSSASHVPQRLPSQTCLLQMFYNSKMTH